MASELAVGYITLIPSAKGITAGIESELGGPLAVAGRTSGAKTSTAFGGAFKTGLKKAAIGVGVVAAITDIGVHFQGAFAQIARGTGATGKTLSSLDDSFRSVLKNGAGSFDQVTQAVTTLYQRTGLTGKALDDFASKEVTLARITKTDVGQNLQSTTSLFNLYGVAVGKQSDALDVLFHASQIGGVSVTQLAADMQTAAPTAQLLGLNINQTAGIVSGLEKAGLPASRVMLGLATTFAKAAKNGEQPVAVIKDLVAQVKAAPNATDAASIAVTKFGISARQAAVLVAGIRTGAIDFNKALDGGKGILATAAATQTLSGRFSHLKNVALVGLEPLAEQTLGAVQRGVNLLIPVVGFLTDHMAILGPVILSATAAFVAFKIALGITHIIQATAAGFNELKTAVLGSTAAQEAATAKAAASVAAQVSEAAAATENAAALTLAAEAAVEAATAGGVVDLAASSAASALLAEAAAATAEAEAMTAGAAATEEATVAAEGFALTPVGAVALAAAAGIAILTGKTALFGKGQKDAGKETNAFIASLLSEGKTLNDTASQVLVKSIGSNQGLAAAYKALGVTLPTVTAAMTGNKSAMQQITDAAKKGLDTGKLTLGQFEQIDGSIKKNSKSLKDGAADYANATEAQKQFAGASSTVAIEAGQAAIAEDQLRAAATNLTTAIINNTDRLRGLQEGLIGIFQSAIALKQGLPDLTAKQKAYDDAVKKSGANSKAAQTALLDLTSARLNEQASIDSAVDGVAKFADQSSHLSDKVKLQTKAEQDLAKAQDALATRKGSPDAVAAAQKNLETATGQVTLAQDKYREAVGNIAAQVSGPLHDALVTYFNDIANLQHQPPTQTVITTPGLDTTILKTKDFRGELDRLPREHLTTITVNDEQALHALKTLADQVLKIDPHFSMTILAAEGRMAGGPVLPGHTYAVGEAGPELLSLGASGGFVTSNPQLVKQQRAVATTVTAEPPRQFVFTGPIQSWDDRDLARHIAAQARRAELLGRIG